MSYPPYLKFKASFTSTFSKCCDSACVQISASIENNNFNTGFERTFCCFFANQFGCFNLT